MILEILINDIPIRADQDNFEEEISKVKFYVVGEVQNLDSTGKYYALNKLKELYVDNDGFLHRESGPALIGSEIICYYSHGKLHRDTDDPARIWTSYIGKGEEYFHHGKLHRECGPSIIETFHFQRIPKLEFWLDGEKVSEQYLTRRSNLKSLLDVPN